MSAWEVVVIAALSLPAVLAVLAIVGSGLRDVALGERARRAYQRGDIKTGDRAVRERIGY